MTTAIAGALALLETPCNTPDQLRERRKTLHDAMTALLDGATGEKRGLLASEQRDFDKARAKIVEMDARLSEIALVDQREAAAAEARREAGTYGRQRALVTDPATYHRGPDSPSFFKDLIHAQRGDLDAADRLRRNNQEVGLESRALGNTGAVGGSGGEFAPPAWIIDEFIALARPGRVTADLFHKEPLPPGVSSVNLPKVSTGTTTAIQTTQNSALSQTDLTTTALESGITTIGGKQVVAQQLLDQTPIPFDRVILEDLSADYALQLGKQVITGTGSSGQLRGYLTPTSASVQTWTQASPTVAGFYGQLAQLQGTIIGSRYKQPDVIVMHPRRWAWIASSTDSSGRPLVVPNAGGPSFNVLATSTDAVGHVGSLLGCDVYTDPNIPTNLGAGTNQDIVLMFVRDDIWFWESDLRAEAFNQPYADSLGVLFRVYNYSAMIPDRYLTSLGQLTGTGLKPPTFAS